MITPQTGPISFVYSTFPDEQTARTIAGSMVEARHAACANLLPGMIAVYRWEGQIETGDEVAVIFKTNRDSVDALIAALSDAHPYDVPAIVVLDCQAALPFANWIGEETATD